MSNLVIVALPAKDDKVWKISSEKVPHMTLLFLGDGPSDQKTQDIVQFVEHAVEVCEHGSFYLDVERRDTLGPDEADVLFFNKRSWNLKWIKEFRAQLLQDPNIKTAYDSTDQYDEWTPHLTLGYPATPANALPDEWVDRFYGVEFDRIAVWVDDYDGPEFRLEYPDRENEMDGLSVAYSSIAQKPSLDEALEHFKVNQTQDSDDPVTPTERSKVLSSYAELGKEFIEHVGVKGMKWGVRNRRGEPLAVAPSARSRVPHGTKLKTKVKVEGGENQPAHEDALKVAEAKAKLKKSGTAALSNKELREVTERVRLEQQAIQATRSSGSRFVRKLLGDQGNQAANEIVREEVRGRAKEKFKTRGES